jgi:hypothetical protein
MFEGNRMMGLRIENAAEILPFLPPLFKTLRLPTEDTVEFFSEILEAEVKRVARTIEVTDLKGNVGRWTLTVCTLQLAVI